MRRLVTALALLAACTAPAFADPATIVRDGGGAPVYVRADDALPVVGLALEVRAGLDRQGPAENGIAALVAESILRTPVASARGATLPLRDAIDARGGTLSFSVAAGSVRFYLETVPGSLPAMAGLLAGALARPAFDAATLRAARAALEQRIDDQQTNPILVGLDAIRTAYYRDAGALPALGTRASLETLGADALRAFHDRWYVRGGAFATLVGPSGPQSEAAARALLAALGSATAPAAPALGTKPFGAEPRRIVTRRDVAVPYLVVGFAAPALGDPDFAPALVLRSLLAQVFDAESATTPPPSRRAVGAIYGYDVAPAQLALWINGGRLEPSVGLAGIDRILRGAAQRELSTSALQRYKESARGEWQLEAITLDERTWEIADAVGLGLDPNLPDGIPAAIDRVTAADVQRVAKRWFAKYDVAIVLPRGGNGD